MPVKSPFFSSKGLDARAVPKRHRKILRDNLQAITRGDIRRLARRGGVYRIQKEIYETTRQVLRKRLEAILREITILLGSSGDPNDPNRPLENGVIPKSRHTVTSEDVVYVLRRIGEPLYGHTWPALAGVPRTSSSRG